jgi:hypothetical protein
MKLAKFMAHGLVIALATCMGAPAQAQGAAVGLPPAQVKHFDPNGKPPSTFTLEVRKNITATLPFADKRDFEEAKKGFIAEPPATSGCCKARTS